ncbi:hypothetical protein ACIBK8_25530 [Streptomyces sp. NPDC050161]|uniref:hypothetical protein n=1 Tax=Streptomyces sp. NPDC050161 TaxID=3365604 RepID=UPI00378E9A98
MHQVKPSTFSGGPSEGERPPIRRSTTEPAEFAHHHYTVRLTERPFNDGAGEDRVEIIAQARIKVPDIAGPPPTAQDVRAGQAGPATSLEPWISLPPVSITAPAGDPGLEDLRWVTLYRAVEVADRVLPLLRQVADLTDQAATDS